MHLLTVKLLWLLVPLVCLAAWVALKFWQDRAPSSEPADPEVNVEAELKATRAQG